MKGGKGNDDVPDDHNFGKEVKTTLTYLGTMFCIFSLLYILCEESLT